MKGEGDQIDYGNRIYDPRVGRFLSVDPLIKKFPWYSPYEYGGLKPVWKKDIDGLQAEGEDEDEKIAEAEEVDKERAQEELSKALRTPTAEEQARQRRQFEEFSRKPKEERESIIRRGINALNAYARNGIEAFSQANGGDPLQNAINQFNIRQGQLAINKQNAQIFEEVVTTQLKNTNSAQVATQVTLLVSGQLNGQNVQVRIRIDNVSRVGNTLNLTEAKYSVEQITGANYSRTLTPNQQTAFNVIANGKNINIIVRGNNAFSALGIPSGTNITGRVADVRVVANNTQTQQPQTVKSIPVSGPSSTLIQTKQP